MSMSPGDFIALFALAATIWGARIALSEWHLKSRHWLYIPEPRRGRDTPLETKFWVFEPVPLDREGIVVADPRATPGEIHGYAVPIAGELVNGGPADAFSLRIFGDPEVGAPGCALEVLEVTARKFEPVPDEADLDEIGPIFRSLLVTHRNRAAYIPVLKAGDSRRFVVIPRFEPDDPYLEHILSSGSGTLESCDWEHGDKQVHGVHAASRSLIGRSMTFGPGDLCAPFESEDNLRRWRKSLEDQRPPRDQASEGPAAALEPGVSSGSRI